MRAVALVAVLGCALAARADDDRLRTLVLGVRAAAASDEGIAFAVSEVVQGAFLTDAGRTVLGRADLAGVATLEADQQMLSCDGPRCMRELAEALDVPRVVTGTLARGGDAWELELVESDAAGTIIARVRVRAPLAKQALLDEARSAARELLAQSRAISSTPREGARVLVRTIPPGAEVEVGGAAWGRAPALATGLAGPRTTVVVRGRDGSSAVVDVPVWDDDLTTVELALRVPPELTPDELDRQNTDRLFELGFGATKLAGGALCCTSSLCPAGAAVLLATTPGVPGTGVAENVAQVAVCAVPAGIAVLLGLGLTTWGVVDLVPGATKDVHRATIVPPPGRGAMTVVELPAGAAQR